MTKDEAIEKLEEMADESRALEHIDEFCGLEQAIEVVKQIDEPKWHKVSKEGLPKEEGLYAFYFGEFKNILPNEKSVYSPIYEIGFVYKALPVSRKLVAWQKIEEYKE